MCEQGILFLQKCSSFREKPTVVPYCHIWYNDSLAPVVSEVSELEKADPRVGGRVNSQPKLQKKNI